MKRPIFDATEDGTESGWGESPVDVIQRDERKVVIGGIGGRGFAAVRLWRRLWR